MTNESGGYYNYVFLMALYLTNNFSVAPAILFTIENTYPIIQVWPNNKALFLDEWIRVLAHQVFMGLFYTSAMIALIGNISNCIKAMLNKGTILLRIQISSS